MVYITDLETGWGIPEEYTRHYNPWTGYINAARTVYNNRNLIGLGLGFGGRAAELGLRTAYNKAASYLGKRNVDPDTGPSDNRPIKRRRVIEGSKKSVSFTMPTKRMRRGRSRRRKYRGRSRSRRRGRRYMIRSGLRAMNGWAGSYAAPHTRRGYYFTRQGRAANVRLKNAFYRSHRGSRPRHTFTRWPTRTKPFFNPRSGQARPKKTVKLLTDRYFNPFFRRI